MFQNLVFQWSVLPVQTVFDFLFFCWTHYFPWGYSFSVVLSFIYSLKWGVCWLICLVKQSGTGECLWFQNVFWHSDIRKLVAQDTQMSATCHAFRYWFWVYFKRWQGSYTFEISWLQNFKCDFVLTEPIEIVDTFTTDSGNNIQSSIQIYQGIHSRIRK
jgi:hypothetical protein